MEQLEKIKKEYIKAFDKAFLLNSLNEEAFSLYERIVSEEPVEKADIERITKTLCLFDV